MKLRFNRLTILAAVALSAVALAATDGISLKRTVKEGQTHKYKLDGKLQTPAGEILITGTTQEKVTKVEANGNYTVEQTQIDGKVSVGGNEQAMPDVPATTTTYAPNGAVLEVSGGQDTDNLYRMATLGLLIDPAKPLAIGDKWSYEVKADPTKSIVAAKADFQVIAEEKIGTVDTIKVKAVIKETEGSAPASSEATQWIDKADGSLVKMDSKWTNAPSQLGPISATVKLDRAD